VQADSRFNSSKKRRAPTSTDLRIRKSLSVPTVREDGVVHLLEGELPDGIFVKVIRE
jgi:hypothetical protein